VQLLPFLEGLPNVSLDASFVPVTTSIYMYSFFEMEDYDSHG